MATTVVVTMSGKLENPSVTSLKMEPTIEQRDAFFTVFDAVVVNTVDFFQIFHEFSNKYSIDKEKIVGFFSRVWDTNKSQISENTREVNAKIFYINYRKQFCKELEGYEGYKQAVSKIEKLFSENVQTINKEQKSKLIKERLLCKASFTFDNLYSISVERALENFFTIRSFTVHSSQEVSDSSEANSLVVTSEHLNILWGTSQNR